MVGVAVLFAHSIAGNLVVGSLSSTASVEPAVSATWSIGTSLLVDTAQGLIFYGIFIVIGAWLAGPTGIAREVRHAIAPILERRAVAYLVMALILIVLFWWAPTQGFHRLPISLLLIALFVFGFEVLRRQAVREFPDQTWERGTERWRQSGRNLVTRRRGRGDQSPPSAQ